MWAVVLNATAALCCVSTLPCFASPAAGAVTRLTDHASPSCQIAVPSPNGAATRVAFESTCDLVGENADNNREIFQVDQAGLVSQLTETAGCVNANPSSSNQGTTVAFDSDCDLGANADGNVEVWIYQSGLIVQLTNTANCANLTPSINAAGNRISFDSDCDITGANFDRSVEIFRSNLVGVIEQLTSDSSISGCASINAASDASGLNVAFESDCDLAGVNPEQVNEIYQHRQNTGVVQLTMSFDEPCVNATPSVSSDGNSVAFTSDCDSLGLNADGSSEILSLTFGGAVKQLTSDPGSTDCESIEPSIAKGSNGDRVVFSGFCDLTGENADGSFEIFRSASGVVSQLTDAESCWSVSPKAAQDDDVFVFVSTCDLDGKGGAGVAQVYVSNVCSCGAPVSNGSPTATDALFALQSAVGAKSCGLCDCDVSGDGSVTASDALRILNKAIGLPIELNCP